jgi:hypothetical protein
VPEALSATLKDNSLVTLAWTDTSANELGFKVERATGSSSFAEIGTVGPDVTAFTDPTIEPDQLYRYRVLAYNAVGGSGYSNEAPVETKLFALTEEGVPAAPTRLAASFPSEDTVQLTWSDNSAREDGFILERSVAGGAWTPVQIGLDTTGYLDSGLVIGTLYSYRVSAYNDVGISEYSNVITITGGQTDNSISNNCGEGFEPSQLIWYQNTDGSTGDARGSDPFQYLDFSNAQLKLCDQGVWPLWQPIIDCSLTKVKVLVASTFENGQVRYHWSISAREGEYLTFPISFGACLSTVNCDWPYYGQLLTPEYMISIEVEDPSGTSEFAHVLIRPPGW